MTTLIDILKRDLSHAEAEVKGLRDRLQIDPGGSDKIDELEQAMQFQRHRLDQAREVIEEFIAEIEAHGWSQVSASTMAKAVAVLGGSSES